MSPKPDIDVHLRHVMMFPPYNRLVGSRSFAMKMVLVILTSAAYEIGRKTRQMLPEDLEAVQGRVELPTEIPARAQVGVRC